jgi:hypothetical protein
MISDLLVLRWPVRSIGRPKTVGSSLILEGAISPSAAVREPLAVLHHEVDIVQEPAPSGWPG